MPKQNDSTTARGGEVDELALIRVLPRQAAVWRQPLLGEACISISNPRQTPAALSGFSDVLRLGFHDTDREGGNFTPMSLSQAKVVLAFAAQYSNAPLSVHCEFGASRSAAIGLFLACWLRRPVSLQATDVLMPNPWVLNQLRAAALYRSLTRPDTRLFICGLLGSVAYLEHHTNIVTRIHK